MAAPAGMGRMDTPIRVLDRSLRDKGLVKGVQGRADLGYVA